MKVSHRRYIRSGEDFAIPRHSVAATCGEPGFRKSDRYLPWRSLLHHFYDPFPVVEHYGDPIATR